jgi:hypothetical protein
MKSVFISYFGKSITFLNSVCTAYLLKIKYINVNLSITTTS